MYKKYYSEYNELVKNEKSCSKLALFDIIRDNNFAFITDVFDEAYEMSLKRKHISMVEIYINRLYASHDFKEDFRSGYIILPEHFEEESIVKEISEDTKRFWGSGFTDEEYIFLENKHYEWMESCAPSTVSERTNIQHICLTLLRIHNKIRNNNDKDIDKDYTTLDKLIKTAGYDAASSKKMNETDAVQAFGKWIADIENNSPAELFEEPDLYVDYNNKQKYYQDYVTRACKNLITGNRDFEVDDEELYE